MQVSQALNPRRIARSLVTVLVLTLISTIAPPTLFPNLLSQSHAAPDGLNAYYRSDTTDGNDKDLSSPFVTNTCLTTKLQATTADWGVGGPTGGTSDCGTENFTAYYTGYILGPKTGTVNFSGVADDVLIVRINGVNVVKKYLNSGTVSGSFNFTAGVAYPIQIWFHEVTGGAAFALNWDGVGSAAVIGSSYLASTADNLLNSQYQTSSCQIGSSAECPAYSPQEIYNLYGTVADGNYWIMTGGAPSYQYVLMDRSFDSGGWILGMKATKTSTNFDWDDTYRWTTHSVDNSSPLEDMSTAPARISATGTGNDGKYESFNTVYAQKIRAVFPEFTAASYGGRYTTNNNYGFMWEESLSSLQNGSAATGLYSAASYPLGVAANCTGISTKVLQDLFANSKRCLFRTPANAYTAGNNNTASYDPIGNNLFASQSVFAWWGINYIQPLSGGSPAANHHSRFGFAWNENEVGNEGSNDVTAGIGLVKAATNPSGGSNNWPTGSYVGCCATQTGQNKQMAFELYLRQNDPSLAAPTNISTTTLSATSVKVSWNAPVSVTPTEYVVQYKTNSSAWDSNATTIRVLAPGANPSVSVTGLTAGTVYSFRVFARTVDLTTKLYDTNSSSAAAYVRYGHEDKNVDSAFNFGANQFFASNTESPFDIPSGTTFTLEAWVRPSSTSGNQIIAGKNGQYSLYISNASFGFNLMTTDNPSGVGGDSAFFGASSVKADEWQHIAFTRSGTSYKFYYNGNLVKASTLSTTGSIKDTSVLFTVGGYSTTDQPFNGRIDQVRVWSSERSLAEINDGMHKYVPTSTSGLVAAYGFNEGTGGTVYDLNYSGFTTRDLTLTGGTQNWVSVATTAVSGPYTYVTFPRSALNANGGWKVPDSITAVSTVVVGGGGGGNAETDATGWMSGGGGAGAYRYVTTSVIGGRYETVTVGLGGRRGANVGVQNANFEVPTNGQDSKFLGFTAIGGGYGGGEYGAGAAGGSGGGGGTYGGAGGNSVSGQGNNGGAAAGLCCASGGGGGAGGAGGNATSAGSSTGTGGAAGNGVLNPLYISGSSRQYLAGGGAGGGLTSAGSAGSQGGTAFATTGAANTGSGGGGGGGGASPSVAGYGGSGIVILRYITAIKPTFTYPTNAYVNAGMTETFTTNVAQDSATAVLTRTFRWESSTTGANGTFSTIKQGTGSANAAFSWVPADTRTTGSNFVYRVIVTDSDTAGLFIQDTSTPVFAVINGTLRMSGVTSIKKTINIARNETFTISAGTPTYRYTLIPTIPGITLDTTTAGTAIIKISDTVAVGTFLETLTVTDSVSASVVIPLSITISAPPMLTNSGEIISTGQVFNFDPSVSASYNPITGAVADISGTQKAITVNGGATYSNDSSGILSLSTSQHLSVTGIQQMNSFTIEAFIKLNSISNRTCVFASENTGYQLCIDAGRTIYGGFYDGSGWTYKRTSQTIDLDKWTHLLVTFDSSTSGTKMELYFNGSVSLLSDAAQNAGLVTTAPGTNRSYINHDYPTNNAVAASMSIGFVRLYNRSFVQADVTQNYVATRTRFDSSNLNQLKPSQKYGVLTLESFTVTSGGETETVSFAVGNRSGVLWDTSTAGVIKLSVQESLTPGTYYDTITVTDNFASSTTLPIRFTVSKADTLTVYVDTPTALSYTASQARFTSTLKSIGAVGLETGTTFSATVKFKPGGSTCATGGYCRVGDIGPAGGIIFIDTSTASSDGRIYEAAPQNWSGSDDLSTVAQFCTGGAAASANIANGSQVGIGWGDTLTANFDAGCSGGAAQVAADLVLNGYSDWFVPSENEAVRLYSNRDAVGLIQLGANWSTGNWGYWTSTESSAGVMRIISNASSWSIGNGNKNEATKLMLRPVRAFKSCWAIDTCTALATTDTPTASGVYQIVPSALTNISDLLERYSNVVYRSTNLTINKVAPTPISIPWINTNYPDTFTVNFTAATGNQVVRYSTTNGTASGCALDYRKVYTTSQGTCTVTITRAADRNYTADTTTATVFFLTFVNAQPTNQVGSGSGIALNGVTSFETSTVLPPSVSSLSTTLLSLGGGGTFTITGTGFTGSITVKFWRNKSISVTSSNGTTIDIPVSSISSAGATSGRIAVITAAGEAISVDSLTITP